MGKKYSVAVLKDFLDLTALSVSFATVHLIKVTLTLLKGWLFFIPDIRRCIFSHIIKAISAFLFLRKYLITFFTKSGSRSFVKLLNLRMFHL